MVLYLGGTCIGHRHPETPYSRERSIKYKIQYCLAGLFIIHVIKVEQRAKTKICKF